MLTQSDSDDVSLETLDLRQNCPLSSILFYKRVFIFGNFSTLPHGLARCEPGYFLFIRSA